MPLLNLVAALVRRALMKVWSQKKKRGRERRPEKNQIDQMRQCFMLESFFWGFFFSTLCQRFFFLCLFKCFFPGEPNSVFVFI